MLLFICDWRHPAESKEIALSMFPYDAVVLAVA